jgi:hypothetical protein
MGEAMHDNIDAVFVRETFRQSLRRQQRDGGKRHRDIETLRQAEQPVERWLAAAAIFLAATPAPSSMMVAAEPGCGKVMTRSIASSRVAGSRSDSTTRAARPWEARRSARMRCSFSPPCSKGTSTARAPVANMSVTVL